jgi:SET domain-containing protein
MPTYKKEITEDGEILIIQVRSIGNLNQQFLTFNECTNACSCDKRECLNFLLQEPNLKKFQYCIRKILKTKGETSVKMWSLVSLEDIPAGAFVMQYVGEVISKKTGDIRGVHYDRICCSYLFDMNDPLPEETYENRMNQQYGESVFPLCIDAGFYGNQSRFINHSCDANLRTFNLVTECESTTFHSIGLFAQKNIKAGEELTIDYHWDLNVLEVIKEDVPCLCGSSACRGFLMQAKK